MPAAFQNSITVCLYLFCQRDQYYRPLPIAYVAAADVGLRQPAPQRSREHLQVSQCIPSPLTLLHLCHPIKHLPLHRARRWRTSPMQRVFPSIPCPSRIRWRHTSSCLSPMNRLPARIMTYLLICHLLCHPLENHAQVVIIREGILEIVKFTSVLLKDCQSTRGWVESQERWEHCLWWGSTHWHRSNSLAWLEAVINLLYWNQCVFDQVIWRERYSQPPCWWNRVWSGVL